MPPSHRPSRRLLLALPLAWTAPARALTPGGKPPAQPPEVARELPDALWRGTGPMRFMGVHIYDARLWSAAPLDSDGGSQALALEIEYARSLSGQRIAQRSIDEMRGIGTMDADQAERWLQAMARLFPDVKSGDRITGVHVPGKAARFFVNGRQVGEVAEAAFARLFFGIWLSPKTSEPGLRSRLIGAGS